MLSNSIAKQAYDRGYDAGERARREPAYIAHNPFREPSPTRNRYRAGDSRYDFWQEGCEDGWAGRPRKISQNEAEERQRARVRLLEKVYEAATALHLAEDFAEMPCQHECCAPGDWDEYQACRQRLYDAIVAVNETQQGGGPR